MGRTTRRSVASKEESTPKESSKSGGRRGAKKTEDIAGGDSHDTPKRSGRQAAKEEQKSDVSAKESSSARGRSTSRGGRGKKEEAAEITEVEANKNEEVEEGKTQKGSTRSRGKGKAAQQDVKTTPGGQKVVRRGRGDKASEVDGEGEENEESEKKEDEKEKEPDEDNVTTTGRGGRTRGKATVATTSSRSERRSRSRVVAAEQEKEEKLEEDSTDNKGDDDDASKIVDNVTESTPKGRQRRSVNKEAESSSTQPSSGARRGRGQKPTPKSSPASGGSARKGGKAAASTDEISENKDKTELMDAGESDEAAESKAVVEPEKSSNIVKAEDEKKESSPAKEAEMEEDNASVAKKAPLKEVKSSTAEKEALDTEEPPTTEKAAVDTEVPSTTEKSVVETEVPSTTEKAAMEIEELPTALETEEAPTTEKAAVETKVPSENAELETELPNTTEKAELETEVPSTAEMDVEESSEPNKKRRLDDGDVESSEPVSPNKKRKLEDDGDHQVAKRAKTDNAEPSEDKDKLEDCVDNPDTTEVATSLPSAVTETSVEPTTLEDGQKHSQEQAMETTPVPVGTSSAEQEKQKENGEASQLTETVIESSHTGDSSGGLVTISSNSEDQPVKDSSISSTGDSQNISQKQKNGVPATEELILADNNSSDTAPEVSQITSAASQTQTVPATDINTESSKPTEPSPEAMEVEDESPSLENTSSDKPVNQTHPPTQNGTKEISVNSGSHLASSPEKSLSTVHKAYVPSSTAIDCRKFILNPAFPIEMMDPAYCFSVVSYNILADCHLCRSDYSYTQPQYLVQDYRHSLLLKELEYLDGDIVCLQEVGPSYYTDTLLPVMKSRGYDGQFIRRTKDNWDEGEATFVRTSKFDIVSQQGVSLKDLAFKEIGSSALGEDVSKAAKKYLDRADVILLTELRCKKSGKTVTVCNIHVVHDPKAPDVQCFQVACAIKQLVAKAGSDQSPHIICGDFNSGVTSPAYQLARDGYLSDDHIHKLQAVEALDNTDGSSRALIHHMSAAFRHTSSNLKNTYENALGKEPPVTSFTKTAKSVDHIFHSVASIDNVGVLETLDLEVLEASGGLPSKSIPSDHLSLKAVFRMK